MNSFRFFWPTLALHPHPSKHSPNSHPVGNVGNSFAAILPFCSPSKISIRGNAVPSAHTVTARVAHLMSFVEVWMVTVLSQCLFIVQGEEDRDLIHTDYIFFPRFFSLTFVLISCIKSRASDAASVGERWDLFVPIRFLNPCAFNHLCTFNDFAPSDLVGKIRHKSDALFNKICIIITIPCSQSSNPLLRRRSSRGANKPGQPECIFLMLDKVWSGIVCNCFFHWQ